MPKVPEYRRVNLKLKPAPHAALSLFVAKQRVASGGRVTLQSYLHSLVVKDMVDKGFLRTKTRKS
jgi:hypothetical protein